MANRTTSDQAANDFFAVKISRDMAHGPMRVKVMIVETGDTSGFLTAMLKCMQAKGNHRGGTVGVMNTKNAALLAKFVVIKWVGGQHNSNPAARRWLAYRQRVIDCLPLVVAM